MNKNIWDTDVSKRALLKGLGIGAGVLAAPALVRAQTKRPAEITLGALCSLTGPSALFGNSAKDAFGIRIEQVNKAGGLWGDGTGMLKLVLADDQSKPGIAVSELSRLARDKTIVALPSLMSSISTIQATTEAERQKIAYINMSAVSKEINGRGLKYSFTTSNNSDGYVQAYLDYTKQIVEASGAIPQRVALVYENKFAGPAFHKAWVELFPKAVTWTLAGDYPYDPATTDFGPLVSRLKADRIDFPVLFSWPQDAILLLRAMREQNYNPLAISGFYGALPSTEVIDALGKGAEYVMGGTPYLHDLSFPGNSEFATAYKAKVGKFPDALGGLSFNGFNGVLAAIRKSANPADRDAVREALASLDVRVGQDGIIIPLGIRIAENGANPISFGGYYQIQNGLHRAILPAEFASAKIVYPRPAWDKI